MLGQYLYCYFSHQLSVNIVSLIFKIVLLGFLYKTGNNYSSDERKTNSGWLMIFGSITFFIWNVFYIVNMTIFFDSNNDWMEKAPLLWGAQLVITIESTVNFKFFIKYYLY